MGVQLKPLANRQMRRFTRGFCVSHVPLCIVALEIGKNRLRVPDISLLNSIIQNYVRGVKSMLTIPGRIEEIKQNIVSLAIQAYNRFDTDEKPDEMSEEELLLREIEQTKKELRDSENYFNNVTDPSLLEHASYLLEANERKFRYLLSTARRKGIKGRIKSKE